jgi:hypothetical protein
MNFVEYTADEILARYKKYHTIAKELSFYDLTINFNVEDLTLLKSIATGYDGMPQGTFLIHKHDRCVGGYTDWHYIKDDRYEDMRLDISKIILSDQELTAESITEYEFSLIKDKEKHEMLDKLEAAKNEIKKLTRELAEYDTANHDTYPLETKTFYVKNRYIPEVK